MLEHRAAVHERLVEQETEGPRRLNLGREQVLARLWEIANLSLEMTRGSVSAQVKALAMIVAIEGLIPDRRAVSSEKKSAPPPSGQIYAAAWLRKQQGKPPFPSPALTSSLTNMGPAIPARRRGRRAFGPWSCPDLTLDSSEPTFAHPFSPSETTPSSPHARVPDSAPDNRLPFSIKKNPFARRH
jgi:hypothetical protein